LKITLPKPNTLARTKIDGRIDNHKTVLNAESIGADSLVPYCDGLVKQFVEKK
jgi:hypothetical protein